jgi:hypothetical protein
MCWQLFIAKKSQNYSNVAPMSQSDFLFLPLSTILDPDEVYCKEMRKSFRNKGLNDNK